MASPDTLFGNSALRSALKKSILPSMVTSKEWEQFASIFKCQTLSNFGDLHLSKKISFFVVVTGEIMATMSTVSGNACPTLVSNFGVGDIIHMFSNSLIGLDGNLHCGDVVVTFSPRDSENGPTTVASADKDMLSHFLFVRPQLSSFKSFCDLSGSLLSKNPLTIGLTNQQLEILCPTLRMAKVPEGCTLLAPRNSRHARGGGKTGWKKGVWKRVPHFITRWLISFNTSKVYADDLDEENSIPMGVLLIGECLLLDVTDETMTFPKNKMQSLKSVSDASSTKSWSPFRSWSTKIEPKAAAMAHAIPANPLSHGTPTESLLRLGSLFGLEQYFLPSSAPKIPLQHLKACEDCIVGQISTRILDALKNCDTQFVKKLNSNLFYSLLKAIQATVPMISDENIGADNLKLLAQSVGLHSCRSGDVIYHQGQTVTRFFVVLVGAVQEVSHEAMLSSKGSNRSSFHSQQLSARSFNSIGSLGSHSSGKATNEGAVYTCGQYFGEHAIVSDAPGTMSFAAVEASVILSITKATFINLFAGRPLQYADMKVKLLGARSELDLVLSHPIACSHFSSFLDKEHASENIEFFQDVIYFNDMCLQLKQNIHQLESAAAHAMNFINKNIAARTEALNQVTEESRRGSNNSPGMCANNNNTGNSSPNICANSVVNFSNITSGGLSTTSNLGLGGMTSSLVHPITNSIMLPPLNSDRMVRSSIMSSTSSSPLKMISSSNCNSQSNSFLINGGGFGSSGPQSITHNYNSSTVVANFSKRTGANSTQSIRRSCINSVSLEDVMEVAAIITEKYLINGASHQVNIPGKMRTNSEKMFLKWVHRVHAHARNTNCCTTTRTSFANNNIHATNLPSNLNATNSISLDSARSSFSGNNACKYLVQRLTGVDITESVAFSAISDEENMTSSSTTLNQLLGECANEIFSKPQHEVFDLMKKDSYLRFKQSGEFMELLSVVKPYEQQVSKTMQAVWPR